MWLFLLLICLHNKRFHACSAALFERNDCSCVTSLICIFINMSCINSSSVYVEWITASGLRINKPALCLICLSHTCFHIHRISNVFIINGLLFNLFHMLVTVTHVSVCYESPGAWGVNHVGELLHKPPHTAGEDKIHYNNLILLSPLRYLNILMDDTFEWDFVSGLCRRFLVKWIIS